MKPRSMQRIDGFVWCDRLGEVHPDSLNPYGYADEESQCEPADHRPVYYRVRSTDG